MSIQPKDSSGGTGETRESLVYKLADDMLSKLPPDYIPHEASYMCVGVWICVDVSIVMSTLGYSPWYIKIDLSQNMDPSTLLERSYKELLNALFSFEIR